MKLYNINKTMYKKTNMTTQYDIKTTHCLCMDITGLKMPPSKKA